MGDVEDPVLYAGFPLAEWQDSESGKWVMEHAIETPTWRLMHSPHTYGQTVYVTADFKDEDATFFKLKYHDHFKRP
jgi:hypothetical protein